MALPLICPTVLGSSQALHLPTWKAESESLGVYSNSSLWPQSGLVVEFPRCPRNASARTKGAESLPSALGQPPSRSSLAPWLRFRNPGSGSSVAPRHSGDLASGLRLPWEPRPGPCARCAILRAGRCACAGRWEIGLWSLRKTAVASGEVSPGHRGKGWFVFLFLLIEV